MGDRECILSLEMLKNALKIVTTNLQLARSCRDKNTLHLPQTLKNGDRVMIKNHTAGPFDPKYVGNYRIVSIRGHQVEIMPAHGGKTKM